VSTQKCDSNFEPTAGLPRARSAVVFKNLKAPPKGGALSGPGELTPILRLL